MSKYNREPLISDKLISGSLRYGIPLVVGAGLAFAFVPLMMLFDPISNFGRGIAAAGSLFGAFPGGVFSLVMALPFLAILVLAFFRGRAFCGWCPVGVTLGLCARFAPFKMSIASACVSCRTCEKTCPAACIDSQTKRIDPERCVLCFSCAAACPAGGVAYRLNAPKVRPAVNAESRRNFLKGAVPLMCGAAYILSPHLRNLLGFSRQTGGSVPDGLLILPPGAGDAGRYRAHCISCQACVAACPAKIIKTSSWSFGPGGPNPALEFTGGSGSGYCQYNCIECGAVCPSGAIRRVTIEEKHRTRIALSNLLFENCVVKTKGESCGACAEVCPTRALRMEPYSESGNPYLTRPVFEEQYCIGCGACLAACPAEPIAFKFQAVAAQSLTPGIRPSDEEAAEGLLYNPADDFPF